MSDSRFPPVRIDSSRVPWEGGDYMPSAPMRLPVDTVQGVNFAGRPGESVTPDQLVSPSREGPFNATPDVRDLHHYARVSSAQIALTTALSVKILDEPATRRNMLMLRNASATAVIYIDFGKVADNTSTLLLSAGAVLLLDVVVPQDDIYAYSSDVTALLSYSYSNIA